MNHETVLDDRLKQYIVDVAGWRMDDVERVLKQHPDEHPEYMRAVERLDLTAANVDASSELGAMLDAWMSYAAALALEMYLAGARDGGRVYHAFITGELPVRPEGGTNDD